MISKHGREFASMAELRRYEANKTGTGNQEILNNGCVCNDGCESCDRLAEAFEALQDALGNLSAWVDKLGYRARAELPAGSKLLMAEAVRDARAALALADAVSKVSR